MPPSPSLRYSSSREPHKGRSLESGLSFKQKDDDLALFNEMQSKEQENFLLQSTDDLEDVISANLKPLPDVKLGIMVPDRGESSGLLNADEDKNDYEWLLTPPDTPLFPSLDDEQILVSLAHSGRSRSQPISIPGAYTMEKSYSSRGSASPQRFSPSPRYSVSSTFQSRERASAPRSSPSPSSRHSTPTRLPSPPPIKPSTPPHRSSAPTPRRSSSGSGAALPSGIRGASHIRTSRGSSSSPKTRAWQSNVPGFSLESPPNLCTSLADRPASYVRGSSPASRNSRDTSSKVRRQSMSPTATRRISSSHSHERDWFNSHSKGSIASSGGDDADSFLSAPGDGLDHSLYRRGVGGLSNSRPISSSKKPSKVFYSSSAPKRSFDTAMRHLDQKSPQNMFRPLLSSVPCTTFYAGKASSSHHAMVSMNSSVTTSSNASSDQATSGAPNTEGSEHNQDDVVSESGRILNTDVNEDIFSFDKMDTASEDTGLEMHHQLPDIQPGEFHNASAFESKADTQAESPVDTLLCFRCGCSYNVTELVVYGVNLCLECKQKEEIMVKSISFGRVDVSHDSSTSLTNVSEEVGSSHVSGSYLAAPEPFEVIETGESTRNLQIIPGEENDRESGTIYQELSRGSCLDNSFKVSEDKASTHVLSDVQVAGKPNDIPDPSNVGIHEINKCNEDPPSNTDVAEGAGISVLLLKRSSSRKGTITQGRSFTATAKSYDVGSYARESTTSIRSSIGHVSVSTSSSIDMGSIHAEMPMQRQLSGRRSDNSSNPEHVGSFSRASSHISQGLGPATSAHEDNLDAFVGSEGHVIEEPEAYYDPAIALEDIQRPDIESHLTLLEGDGFNRNSEANDTPALELSVDVLSNQSDNSSFQPVVVDKEQNLHVIDDHLPKKVASADKEVSAATHEYSLTDENAAPIGVVDQMEILEAPHNDQVEVSEIEIDDCHLGSPGSQNDVVSGDALQESSAQPHEHKDASSSTSNSNELEVAHGTLEESTAMEEHQEGRRSMSLTLEEATDAILFCSSIVHNLAYEAANIAIDEEEENLLPLEGSRPTVTIVGRPSSNRDLHGRSIIKRNPKVQKERRRQEAETDLHYSKTAADDDDKPREPAVRNVGLPPKTDSMKPPKLESKCNCTIM